SSLLFSSLLFSSLLISSLITLLSQFCHRDPLQISSLPTRDFTISELLELKPAPNRPSLPRDKTFLSKMGWVPGPLSKENFFMANFCPQFLFSDVWRPVCPGLGINSRASLTHRPCAPCSNEGGVELGGESQCPGPRSGRVHKLIYFGSVGLSAPR